MLLNIPYEVPYEAKDQFLINKWGITSSNHLNDSKTKSF